MSGGHNKTHGCISDYSRIDSFRFNKGLSFMNEKGLNEFKGEPTWIGGQFANSTLYKDKLVLEYFNKQGNQDWEHIHDTIYFSTEPNNYGGNRLYFECPECSNRFRFLYHHWGCFICRQCSKLNYTIQQRSKGFDVSLCRMRHILYHKLRVKENLAPIDMKSYIPDKPKGMHYNTYNKHLIKLREVQKVYYCDIIKHLKGACRKLRNKNGGFIKT